MTEDTKDMIAPSPEAIVAPAAPAVDPTKARKEKNRQANLAAMQLLLDNYPEIFSLEAPKPLKIGIHDAIAEDGKLSKTKIRRALATYVRQSAYLRCLREDADRVSLNGELSGKVSKDESDFAKQSLIERKTRSNQARQARTDKQAPDGTGSSTPGSKEPSRPRRKPQRPGPARSAKGPAANSHDGSAKPQTPSQPKKPDQPQAAVETGDPAERMQRKLDQLLANLGGPKN